MILKLKSEDGGEAVDDDVVVVNRTYYFDGKCIFT